jgi:hypothetical protein
MNLGEDFVDDLINDEEDWLCLVCNPKQVSALTTAMEACIANSMYSINFKKPSNTASASNIKTMLERNKMILESENTGDTPSDSDSDGELEENVARLTTVISYINDTNKMLENEYIEIKKQEIKEEYIEENKDTDISTVDQLVTEEIALFQSLYTRQHDILSRQESDLTERLAYKGYRVTLEFIRDAEAGVLDHDDEDGTSDLMKESVNDDKGRESEIDQKEKDRNMDEENKRLRVATVKKNREREAELIGIIINTTNIINFNTIFFTIIILIFIDRILNLLQNDKLYSRCFLFYHHDCPYSDNYL